jgi:hypothetical protein
LGKPLPFSGRLGDDDQVPLRRALLPRGPVTSYAQAVRDVLGSPGKRPTDSLALNWAHQIAWAAHGSSLDELEQLAATAERYGASLVQVLHERELQRGTAPVVPAHRREPTTSTTTPARRRAVARS